MGRKVLLNRLRESVVERVARRGSLYRAILIGLCATFGACVDAPPSAQQKELLLISSQGIAGSAVQGNRELSEYNDAHIVLFIHGLDSKEPATELAPPMHTGTSRSKIALPEGWELSTPVVPGGGCLLQPVHLYNPGTGRYTLSVMTMSVYGPCPWLKGEYAYSLAIETDNYSGGTVGRIVIR